MNKIIILFLGLLTLTGYSLPAQDRQVVVRLNFNSEIPSDLQVVPAVLKYDKDFAFSFTFDDGYKDAYSMGYKLFNGGISSVDGITYPGLFYTDGCGNLMPFKAGIAWYTANQSNTDLHFNTPGNLSYTEAVELYHSGWDFFNHSYNHDAGIQGIDYLWQLRTNFQIFKNNTGISLNYCVPPSGDTAYIAPAFTLGNIACFTSNSSYTGYGSGTDVTLPVNTRTPVFYRHLINSDNFTAAILKSDINSWVATTGAGSQKWLNEFTHRIDYSHIGSSMEFPAFRDYMQYIENQYGKPGRDNGWITGSTEVFEYIMVRDQIRIFKQITGSNLGLIIDYSNVPANYRYYNLSLLVRTNAGIQSVTLDGPGKVTYAVRGNNQLINIDLPDSYYSGIEPIPAGPVTQLAGYPNPSNGHYQIQVPENLESVEVRISDLLARSMPDPKIIFKNGLISMDLEKEIYPSGLYFVRLYSNNRPVGFSKLILEW